MISMLPKMSRFVLGRRSDWHLNTPRRPRFRFGPHVLGPLAMVASCVIAWPAFASATGEGNVALGLWVGAVSIMLMAWTNLLSVRARFMEPLWGGLDSMYRSHRWAGTLSVLFMFLHTSIEPEIQGGIRGASRSVAGTAEDLAGTGEVMLYGLVALSLLRLFPYRWWRLTHKLLGIPFAFACWHFYTASKPYSNGSAWGWFFGAAMIVGLAAYVVRVVGLDMVLRGRRYQVSDIDHTATTTRLVLKPTGRRLQYHPGQFAFVKLDVSGMREPHPFTIASSPESGELEFYIRHLGDWSGRLPEADLLGATARIEGPFGEFEPIGAPDQRPVWVAGGVGITPFLAVLRSSEPLPTRPTLLYATRDEPGDPILATLRDAADAGRVDLHLFISGQRRLTVAELDGIFPEGLDRAHVALCGPTSLVNSMADAAAARGASTIETEDFDIRQGFGPERSKEFDDAVSNLRSSSGRRLARA